MEKMSTNRIRTGSREEELEKEKWEKILANEGMPPEIQLESGGDDTGNAVYDAIRGHLETYYLTTPDQERTAHGRHIAEMERVVAMMKAEGSDSTQIEEFKMHMDDFAKDVEDAVARLEFEAHNIRNEVVTLRPMLEARPMALAQAIEKELTQRDSAHDVRPATIRRAAEKVAGIFA